MQRKLMSDIKVGAFVLMGMVFFGLVVFLIGNERKFFETAVDFRAEFKDVQGLKPGAPIRMGGVRIGRVSAVDYGDKVSDQTVYVTLEVVSSDAGRIRTTSKINIVNKGMLGDKMIEIAKGEGGEVVEPGEKIPASEPEDMLSRINRMAGKAENALGGVDRVATELANEDLHRDLRKGVRELGVLLQHLNEGKGYPHRFINDASEADRISKTVTSVDQAAIELTYTLREIRMLMGRVRTGPGFAHDVIVGEGPKAEIAQFGAAAGELATTLKAIREGDGFAKSVLFGGDPKTGDALTNVTAITADMRDIVKGVKDGKGTLGALLVDPSVYEDVKRLLGNVERNILLRAVVRYGIKQGEQSTPTVSGTTPGAVGAAAPAAPAAPAATTGAPQ